MCEKNMKVGWHCSVGKVIATIKRLTFSAHPADSAPDINYLLITPTDTHTARRTTSLQWPKQTF